MSEWEGGNRQPAAWRRAGIALLVVALVGLLAWSSLRGGQELAIDTATEEPTAEVSEHVEIVVTGPLQAGDLWYCPSTHPFRAYDDGTYYPPAYPRGNEIARPDECYGEDAAAEAAGYRLAPPPPNTRLVEGIYLEPTQAPSARDCQALAGAAGYAVPCPTRLPAPASVAGCDRGRCMYPDPATTDAGVGIVLVHNSFSVPTDIPWVGVQRDVVVTAVPIDRVGGDGAIRVDGPVELVSCFPENGLRPQGRGAFRTCVDARPWVPGNGGFPLEGRTSAVWQRGNVVYAAGVEGAGDHVEALLRAVIEGISYVAPP